MSARTRRHVALAAIGSLALLVVGACAPVTPRLARHDPDAGYRYATRTDAATNSEETFVIVTLSGGGTRAAALGYGVLAKLAATTLPDGRSLLDEVDVVSAVSGGSFAAAHLGLFGPERFLREFPDAVLYRNLEHALLWRLAAPWNWPRLLSPRFSRSDLAAEYYGAALFEDRPFAALPAARPFVILNATDIARGAPQLSFTQENLDPLCIDLDRLPVGRAVAAASAFPVAFPPVVLTNHGRDACDYARPLWIDNALGDFDHAPRRYTLATTRTAYEDAAARPFLHLSDGGLADNLGLRAIQTGVIDTRSIGLLARVSPRREASGVLAPGVTRRVVVITVDAEPDPTSCLDCSARPADIFSVLYAAATTPMENYSAETTEWMRLLMKDWETNVRDRQRQTAACDALARDLCAGKPERCVVATRTACYTHLGADPEQLRLLPNPARYYAHVRLAAISDPDVKTRLQRIPTRLRLDREEVDLLVEWGGRLLAGSEAFRRLAADIAAAP